MKKKYRKLHRESVAGIIILLMLCLICILPLLMVVSASLTDEKYIQMNGYSLLPVSRVWQPINS